MRTGRHWKWAYRGLQTIEILSLAAISSSGIVQCLNNNQVANYLPRLPFEEIKLGFSIAAPIATAILIASNRLRSMMGHPFTWEQVQAILDQLQEDLFGDDPPHQHRVTLFKYRAWSLWGAPWRRKFYWLWGHGRFMNSGWLIPVVRSGHGNKRCSSRFLAPDDLDNAEGVAGAAWALGKQGRVLSAIEDLPALNDQSTPDERDSYAKRGMVPRVCVDWFIKKRKIPARSYAGCPVEVKNAMWGVLVLDSRSEQLPGKAKLQPSLRTAVRLLGITLKGA